jgi:hypothetical protein
MVEDQCNSTCATSNCIEESAPHNQNCSNACGCQTTTAGDCDGNPCCEADPIEKAKQLLERSFFAALKEVHVEKIKKIIERDWGDTIDKTAELTVKTIEKQWQASISASNTKKEFYEELGRIMASKGDNGKQA